MIGVDFGGTRIKAGIVHDGAIEREEWVRTPKKPAAVLDAIADLVRGLEENPDTVGVAICGEVDDEGLCRRLPNVKGFEGVPIARELTRRLGCPVAVENDATAAALAERRYGHGRKRRSFLLVTLGTGIGGGLCIDGVVRRGRHGFAGEIGHVLVDSSPQAWICGCGLRGCMEAYAGTEGLVRRFKGLGGRGREVRDIAQSARQREAAGVKTFEMFGHMLGAGLAVIQNVLDLDALVFSGGVAASLDLLEPHLRVGLRSRAYAPALAEVAVLESELGPLAGVVGASLLPAVMVNE